MTKLSKVSFFLFITIYNYLWFRIILFSYIYNNIGNMGVLGIAILAVAVLFIFAIMPKKLLEKDYADGFNKSIYKYIYYIILILESIFGLCFCTYLLAEVFIVGSNPFCMLFFLSLIMSLLSKAKPFEVMEISTLFSIVGYVLLFASLMLFPTIDLTVLLPFKSINYLFLPFVLLMIIGDNLSLIINKENLKFSKLNYIMGILTAIFFLGLEYFMLVCCAGTVFFKDLDWVGFIILSIEPVSKYFGNFDFAYIFFIVCSSIFKYSFNLSIVRNSLNLNKKVMSFVMLGILVILGYVTYTFIPLGNTMMLISSILLMLSFTIFIWFLKECYFVRKSKK